MHISSSTPCKTHTQIQAAIQTLSSHFATKQIAVDSLYCCYSDYCSEVSEFMKFILSALMMRWAELGNVDSSSTGNGKKHSPLVLSTSN